jgi:3'(2'), 5'-bisphosphate nucleotidase
MDHARIEDTIKRLAIEAGALIMTIYESADLGVRAKEDSSPVTLADEAADAHIHVGLRAAFPDIPVVTEEQIDSHTATAPDLFFIVDPLDGTKEFVQRRGDFTVNIALVQHGAPLRGVVYAPAKGRIFYTDAAGNAYESKPDGTDAARLAVAAPDNGALRVVASKSHRDAALEAYIALYQVADSVAAGSSLKFCLVAAGEADIYPRLGRTMEWDTAAGHAVLLGAGGAVDRLDGTGPLTYGKPGWDNPFFVGYAPGVTLKAL